MNPAIVLSAFNRPHALERLLACLARAEYGPECVPLIISIDRGEGEQSRQVTEIAARFHWPFGEKRVICHERHLGLVEHVWFCLGLSEEYGAVVFLEDDLGVSPVFFKYASQALSFYADDPQIAGLSLYALWFNGYTRQPFVPWQDGADVFFLQLPYTQGQAWTAAQWRRFADWRSAGDPKLSVEDPVHDLFLHFDGDDWFPLMTKYLVETNRYWVYPRFSLSNAYGDIGTHFDHTTRFLQVPLLQRKESFELAPLCRSVAVYDSFFEMLPDRLDRLADGLRGLDYEVDLYATKRPRHLKAELVLTTRRTRRAIRSFGMNMWPHEVNAVEQIPGNEIVLCPRTELRWDLLAEIQTQKLNYEYFTRGQRLGRKKTMQFAALGWVSRLMGTGEDRTLRG